MSRPPQNAISVRHSSSAGGGSNPPQRVDDQDETCPVCKTTRYFNKDMEFLINPECYHRMCKTCVERIFKDGPNQCPYATCRKTLRLRGFRTPWFSDLAVEREVDIRRRVAAVFNKVEDDFESLDAYNDYLYMVECLTDDLVNGGDEARRKAEGQLSEWEARHKAEIERNKKLARETEDARQKRLAAEKEAARQRRLRDMQEEADEKANAARFREEMLNSLQTAEMGRADEVVDRIMLKKRGQQKRDAALGAMAAGGGSGLSIRGLREKKAAVVDDGPYDPYGGLDLTPSRVALTTERLGQYRNEWLDVTRTKDEYKVGGYSPNEYLTRALYEAFSGLGVFIAEDKGDKSVPTAGAAQAVAAGQTAGRMDVDDPF
ncbi:RNA polymerase II transcription factor B subunit-like protein [Hapsidospora chrysogenum ATCC 11550]|uniref:RNA polymerase II transcription factor B subunit 3 n=1 Tax=Hapsidospora chrysogenum (strain ATCC 11550 / CBS 779.69 / DSM 880 / IAM 14645 / JCM 23072 / IMI 49137) TaxID=857340 RepID=A0A086T510_HAPC1|nr:RNA polymerase II transcription factor B subunit-like protein [Hapsidospora chrysogenum ATCC 11550]